MIKLVLLSSTSQMNRDDKSASQNDKLDLEL